MIDSQDDTIFKKVINFIIKTRLAKNKSEVIDKTSLSRTRLYALEGNYKGKNASSYSIEDIQELSNVFGEEVMAFYETLAKQKSNIEIEKEKPPIDKDALKYVLNHIDLEKKVDAMEKEFRERLSRLTEKQKAEFGEGVEILEEMNEKLRKLKEDFKI